MSLLILLCFERFKQKFNYLLQTLRRSQWYGLLSLLLTLLLAWHPGLAQETGEPLAQSGSTVELTPAEQAYIQANPVLRVHAESEWPPYNFVENGNVKGFSNEYIQLIAQKVGLEVEFVVGPTWDEFITLLAQKKIDVVTNMVITEDRNKFAIYSEEYVFDLVNSLLTRKSGEDYTDFEQLKGKNLAIVRGFFFEEILSKYYPDINLLLTNNTLDAMKQVEAGRADAALESHATFNYYIDRYFLTDLVSRPLIGNPHFSRSIFRHPQRSPDFEINFRQSYGSGFRTGVCQPASALVFSFRYRQFWFYEKRIRISPK